MSATTERTFDRVPFFDERSRSFPIRTLVADRSPRSYTWRIPGRAVLDQGREGACVGHAWAHEVGARPKPGALSSELAFAIYREAQRIDEWPGESYEGTSVLAGAKVVQGMGHMGEYRWAFSLSDLRLAVGYAGPAVLGVNWHASMFAPAADGYLRVSGDAVGGHAIMCHGYSTKRRAFRLLNSWGADWGRAGEAWISEDDLGGLLDARGEACVPVVRQLVR